MDFGGHSYINNYLWSKYFADAVFAGEFFPKWISQMTVGCGSSVFFFYSPFPYYVAAIFDWLPHNLNIVAAFVLAHFCAGVAFYYWALEWCKKKPAIIGSFVYILMPYIWIDMYIREAFTEFFAFALIPLLLKFTLRIINGNYKSVFAFSVIYALLIMSTLHGVLLGSLLVLAYSLYLFYEKKSFAGLFPMAAGTLLGLGLAAFYLLPLIEAFPHASLSISGDVFKENYYFANNFFPNEGNVLMIAILNLMAIITIFILPSKEIRKKLRKEKFFVFWLVTLFTCLFMTTILSYPIWKVLPFFQILQFPYRFYILISLIIPTLIAYIFNIDYEDYKNKLYFIFPVFLITVFALVGLTRTPLHANLGMQYSIVHQPNEYIPRYADRTWLTAKNMNELKKNLEDKYQFCTVKKVVSDDAEMETLDIKTWKNRELKFDLSMKENGTIKIGQFDFPNRVAFDGEKPLAITPSEKGFISLNLPKGEHNIRIIMKQWKSEFYGFWVSGLSLLLAFAVLIFALRNRQRKT